MKKAFANSRMAQINDNALFSTENGALFFNLSRKIAAE